jgi:hypothetical protein
MPVRETLTRGGLPEEAELKRQLEAELRNPTNNPEPMLPTALRPAADWQVVRRAGALPGEMAPAGGSAGRTGGKGRQTGRASLRCVGALREGARCCKLRSWT